MAIFTLALKDLRLLVRDVRSAVILLVTPLLLILVLGMALGEGFGEKPDERLRISIVNLDRGLTHYQHFPDKPWSDIVIDDLSATEGLRIEIVPNEATAEQLVNRGSRAAVLVFEPDFSERMNRCSFLSQANPPPINPLGRDGVRLNDLGLHMLENNSEPVTAAMITQVTQVTLLRVLIPWMIGRAFDRVGDPDFMDMVAKRLDGVKPIPPDILEQLDPIVQKMLKTLIADPQFKFIVLEEFQKAKGSNFVSATQDALVIDKRSGDFERAVQRAFHNRAILERMGAQLSLGEVLTPAVRKEIGPRVQEGVADLFSNYDFHAKTWAGLVKSTAREANEKDRTQYHNTSGSGFLNRGALRYQILVPSYTVMFAFFLVLNVGWLFVAERKNGTLVRLRAAPLTRSQILFGKLLPCLMVSLAQGFFLLGMGRLIFGMTWGSHPELLIPVVVCTSAAAVGLSMLVASIARTETQVAVYGTLLVLVLGGVSGSLMPRDLMPEQMRKISLVTPQAWALDAYSQLLASSHPDLNSVFTSCGVLLAFGCVFTLLAWWRMDLS